MGGLLHDIGKALPSFQAFLSGTSTFDSNLPLHHEVSWAVLRAGGYRNKLVLNSVYWHHARPLNDKYDFRELAEDILSSLDVSSVITFCASLGVQLDPSLPDADVKVPDLYDSKAYLGSQNSEYMAVRACVIAADRYVSSLGSDLNNFSLSGLDKYFGDVGAAGYGVPQGYDPVRFQRQVDCVKECLLSQTSQVNAPAGFGKTLQGVLYSLERGKRTYWVTPRNVIAESIYDNIQRELGSLGVNRSVELFLGGERKACTDSSVLEGFSDIVVTNIDNLLKPMVSNEVADKLYLSLVSDVVFDEYHEFVSSSPMFSAFVYFMRLRHQLTDVPKTLLLSATPMLVKDLWDLVGKKTLVLPSPGTHYPAAHGDLYKVSINKGTPSVTPGGGVTIMNSIKNAQDAKVSHKADVVAHSKFTKNNRKTLMDFLLSKFGKGGTGVVDGVKVTSAPILQAALDISFGWMQESVLSPESTLQRLGRLNRWGGMSGSQLILLLADSDRKENAVANTVYSLGLRDLWMNLLEQEFSSPRSITLQDMYDLYSKYYQKHGGEILKWMMELIKKGTEQLSECAPVKLPKDKRDKDEGTTGKSLRTPGGSYFYTVKDSSGTWLPPGNEFSWSIMELKDALAKNPRKLSDWGKVVKALLSCGYTGFTRMGKDLKRMKKEPGSFAHRWSRKVDMPYPMGGLQYDGDVNAIDVTGLGLGILGLDTDED